jgi:replicative DNA helicase
MTNKIKFGFTVEFQLETLRFFIQDKESILVIKRVKPSYYTLIEHSLIMESLVKFVKKKGKVPSINILKEVIKEMLNHKHYVDLVLADDIPNIFKIVSELYSTPLKDRDYIKEKIYEFSTYVEMKNLNESFDLQDFEQYGEYSRKVDKILRNSKPKVEEEPIRFIRDITERQFKRRLDPDVIPSPFRQLNDLTNAGGFPSGSVLVLLDKPKAKKTFFLINIARGYLRMKKSVLYIDTENGKEQIMDRFTQSSLNITKKELYSGDFDKKESGHVRKLHRFGIEFVVDRVPALITDCNYIRDEINKLRANGVDIKVLIVDYGAKLASINKDKDDFERISNVYVDLQNLADEMNLDCIWTANHITREGSKHRETKYEETDISGSISIVRNAQGIYGLNATAQEEADGIQRLEICCQRDGKFSGRAVFKVDVERQRAIELTREQRISYDQVYGNKLDQSLEKKQNKPDIEKAKSVADI